MPLIPPALNRPVAIATDVLRHVPFGPRLVTSAFVALLANGTPPRPRPFTLAGDYTSWISLTDRSFTGRHLPVAPEGGALPTRGRGARPVPAAAGGGDPVGRHQRAVPAVRPVVHRQLPAHRPHRLAQEHLDPGDRLLPDLRAVGGEDPAAALDGGRPAGVAADRRPGVPAVPVRAHGRRPPRGQAGVQGAARRGLAARRPARRGLRPAEGPVLRRGARARQLHRGQHGARRRVPPGAQPDRRAARREYERAASTRPGTAG